jgi:hypothetical protein
MAPINALRSRAMATTPWLAFFPLALSCRERVHRRLWAVQLLSWLGLGTFARRHGRGRLTVAGSREAQAPSTRARRAWLWPVLGMPPCWRCSPVEDAEGVKPRECSSCRGGSTRGRSPRAAPVVTAPGQFPPRRAGRAATTGASRQRSPWSVRSGSRRASRSVWSVIARTDAWHTICGAGVGQPTSRSHRRGGSRWPSRSNVEHTAGETL